MIKPHTIVKETLGYYINVLLRQNLLVAGYSSSKSNSSK